MKINVLVGLLLVSQVVLAVDRFPADDLLQAVRKSGLPPARMSLFVVEGEGASAHTLLSVNSQTSMIPASVTKLVTAAATLRAMPPGTRFNTQLLAAARENGEVLTGNLIMKGGGDPSFVSETLWVLVNHFAQTGIRVIKGDIVVDDSYFDDVLIDPKRGTKRSEMAYDAPISAMSFNWNSASILIKPSDKLNHPATVIVEPASDYVRVEGKVNTTQGNSVAAVMATRRDDTGFYGNILKVSGVIGQGAHQLATNRNVTQPSLWAGANLRLYLGYLGVKVEGDVRRGVAPAGARILAQVEGRPIEQIVVDMNKISSNFIAEMLAKNLAAQQTKPGTMAAGMQLLSNYLASLGLAEQEFTMLNPSGLTRENGLSANALVRVLQDMGSDFRYETEFMASLPVAGIDGTLIKRMQRSPAKRWVRAKTGYIDGVVSLAGYAGRSNGNGPRVAFAFIYNGPDPAYKVRALYDELCALMVTEIPLDAIMVSK